MMRSARERRHEPRRHDPHRRRSDHDPAHGVSRSRRPRARWSRGSSKRSSSRRSRCLLDVLQLEAQERHERRITRLRRASKLPPGKTFDTLDEGRLPPALVRRLHELADGDFLDDATNVLAFGLPGVGKSHAMCAVGHALIDRGHAVLFMPTYSLVQELLAAKRNLELPRALRKLDHFAVLILDDVGYIQQSPEEAEILFTLLAERYERRSVFITSNLIFAQLGSDLPRSDGHGRGDRSPRASLGPAGIRCPQLPDRARQTPREGLDSSRQQTRLPEPGADGPIVYFALRDFTALCGRLRACRRSGAACTPRPPTGRRQQPSIARWWATPC